MGTGRKILVLESDHAAAYPLSAALRRSGWIVISAQDAAAAMSVARQQKPDAVLLNSRLAGGGGLVALKRLRSSVYTTLIPVICIVPPDSPEKQGLVDAGAQETVDPPGDPQAIDAALRRHLARGEEMAQVPRAVLREPERLKALADSHLLDTPPDDRFDRVAQLAAKVMEAPLARLSIVDGERQFFKSQISLAGPPPESRQTPLSHSICQWVVGGNEELIVGDTRVHPVLRTNLAVREHGAIAYAGVPFSLDGETVLGAFCVVDSKPHIWSDDQVATLRDLRQILQAYATTEARLNVIGKGSISATSVLLRGHSQYGEPERGNLCTMIHDLSDRVVHVASPQTCAV